MDRAGTTVNGGTNSVLLNLIPLPLVRPLLRSLTLPVPSRMTFDRVLVDVRWCADLGIEG
jgi:hypothetical protein